MILIPVMVLSCMIHSVKTGVYKKKLNHFLFFFVRLHQKKSLLMLLLLQLWMICTMNHALLLPI